MTRIPPKTASIAAEPRTPTDEDFRAHATKKVLMTLADPRNYYQMGKAAVGGAAWSIGKATGNEARAKWGREVADKAQEVIDNRSYAKGWWQK